VLDATVISAMYYKFDKLGILTPGMGLFCAMQNPCKIFCKLFKFCKLYGNTMAMAKFKQSTMDFASAKIVGCQECE